MKTILTILFVVAFACIPIGLAARYRFLKRLEIAHRDLWASLGEPKLFDTYSTTLRVLKLLFSDQPTSLGDPALKQAALIERATISIAILASAVYVVLFLVYIGRL